MNKKSTLRSVANNYLTHPKQNKGITLISLVITVIVLLILAGVAVSVALNEGNLFAKANEAKTSWNAKASEEETRLNSGMAILNEYFRVTSDQKVIVTSDPVKGTYTSGNVTVTLKYGENNDAIPTDYVMQYQEKANESATPGEWAAYTAPMTVETQGKYIRGRLYNATLDADTGTSEWFIVDNIDRENPTVPTAITKVSSTDTSITVQASGGNDDSGTWMYEYKIGDGEWSTAKATTETHTFTGLSVGNTYTIQARTKDVAGKYSNTTKSVQIPILLKVAGTITVDGQTRNVTATIPAGYTVSDLPTEDEISEGLVIYQGTEKVSTDTNAATTRNQFVWVPVYDINSMIMCIENNKTADANNNKICNITQDAVTGELTCTTHNKTGATNICGRLYGVDASLVSTNGGYIYRSSMNFSDTTQIFSPHSSFREPDVVTDNNTDNYLTEGTAYDGVSNIHGLASASAFLNQLQTDFYAMAKSVALNKGFYIGRYEAGYDSTTYTSKKGQVVMDASTTANKGANMWYGLYNHLRTTMGSLNSQMIWGCQYDQVIKFIMQNKGTNELDPTIGHTNIGLKTSKDVSGAAGVSDIMKNIYDLEGNVCEWTAQASYNGLRTYRGNAYSSVDRGYFSPASERLSQYPTRNFGEFGSRPGLYL